MEPSHYQPATTLLLIIDNDNNNNNFMINQNNLAKISEHFGTKSKSDKTATPEPIKIQIFNKIDAMNS